MSALSIRNMNRTIGERELDTPELKFSDKWRIAIERLQDLLGNDFDAWYDGYPENMSKGELLPIMEAKIAELMMAEREQQRKAWLNNGDVIVSWHNRIHFNITKMTGAAAIRSAEIKARIMARAERTREANLRGNELSAKWHEEHNR